MSYPKVLVIVPTHSNSETLVNALGSIKNQTYENLAVEIIGDGASGSCSAIAKSMCQKDARFTFHDNPKSPRRGEHYRNEVLSASDADYVTYLADDDHFLQDHVQTLLDEISGLDFINPFPTFIDRNEQVWIIHKDIAKQEDRLWHLAEKPQNSIALSGVMHTMDSYRKLAQGWSTTPESFPWTDLWMWRKFLEREDFKVKTSKLSTIHKFLGTSNDYDIQKIEQNDYWFKKTLEPKWFSRLNEVVVPNALRVQKSIEESKSALVETVSELVALRLTADSLEKEIVEIRSSKSWRLTQPLRKIQDALRST